VGLFKNGYCRGKEEMSKHAWWNWILLLALLAGSLSRVIPWKDKVRFGLDLKGGISFVVKVDEEKIASDIRTGDGGEALTEIEIDAQIKDALDGALDRSIEVLRNRLNRLGIEEPSIVKKADRIEIQLPGVGEEKRDEAEQLILSVGFLEFRMVHERSQELIDRLLDMGKAPKGWQVVTLDNRKYCTMTDDVPAEARDAEFLREQGRFEVPDPRYEFLFEEVEIQGHKVYRPYFVNRHPVLRSRDLKNSKLGTTGLNQYAVDLEFTSRGAKRFADITEQYAPGGALNPSGERQLAIVIDGTLYSAPRIKEPIYGGRAQITGSFKMVEAKRLVNVLRSGALPTRVRIEEKRYVAPSLGKDSIDSGLKSILIGGIGVVLFMALYYMLCGVVANAALVLNMLLLPLGMIVAAGFMSMGKGGGAISLPVLTLPGVAGILLTIGMAVDANVLIFERIREEMRSGKKLLASIMAGYDRAFITIMDANVTTLMTGVILFIFGSGPIRGFAVTLCGGILVSMYTALVVTKLIFGVLATKTPLKSLRMLSIIKEKTAIDFVGKRGWAMVLSAIVIMASCGLLVTRAMQSPGKVFGVDFTGGSATTFSFVRTDDGVPVSVESLRETLDAAGVVNPVIQYQKEIDSNVETSLQVKAGLGLVDGKKSSEVVTSELQSKFPEAGFKVEQVDEVGSEIGDELKRSALWSVLLALLGIIIYISWRFEFGFALGAISALVHDVLVTLGLFSLSGNQISLPIVAALLTIVGYSVNDTIVVFDRIREDLKLDRRSSFKDLCNLSINQTLSRTILTSFTTLITVAMLLIFGGGAIFDFALALCIGVLVGTYSSIFIATPGCVDVVSRT
jgi:SecD/SecF fusion protein